jgi:hypothetical protein
MRKRKSICGLCKPTKKWKKRSVKKAEDLKQILRGGFGVAVKLRELRK